MWTAPLIAGGVGAAVLAVAAGLVRREVARLQRSMRPLRVRSERPRRPRSP
ncbi:MAG TPA: hypothetical protein VFH58_03560 [Acidimicrobiales bacterium]|nr:hypothetical protein [Acidimicrobiales bacterium]